MPRNLNRYQQETSPRKLEPNYTPAKKERVPKKSTAKKTEVKKSSKRKSKVKKASKQKVKMVLYIIVGFIILFAMSYRNSQIDENFAEVKKLEGQLSEVKKQNAQLEISIENSLNLNNVEQQAKERLGMQKLNNKQTVYVNLPKADYIETPSEDVIIEEKTPVLKSIINQILNIFK